MAQVLDFVYGVIVELQSSQTVQAPQVVNSLNPCIRCNYVEVILQAHVLECADSDHHVLVAHSAATRIVLQLLMTYPTRVSLSRLPHAQREFASCI